jgi:hypothetical protein
MLRRHVLHDAQGVVTAAIKNDDQLKFSFIMFGKVFGVTSQNGANPALLVVGRNEQQ